MLRYILGRLLQAIPLLFVVTLTAFAILHLAPGDPAALLYGTDITADQRAQIRAAWGLDDPIPVQYVKWLGNFLRGDLGRSFSDGRPVLQVIVERIPATLQLTLTGLLIAIVLGLSIGTLAALRANSFIGYISTLLSTFFYSLPNFWLALLLILIFSVWLQILPSAGIESPRGSTGIADRLAHLAMPAFVISLREMGRLIRFTRASLLDVLNQDYIRTARSKGLRERQVALRHAFRNALIPIITLLGLSLPQIASSSIVVETVFAWPGIGRLIIESAFQRNYPVLMGEIVMIGLLVIAGNLIADICYAFVDPRIRYGDSL
ncbi:MAG: ABC transporter permease [Chloroflexi bacterium]|nr:ABC transporter permease [Chloroflexota bacterium]